MATAPWVFDERYFEHIVIGLNVLIELLKQTSTRSSTGMDRQNVHVLVALLEEVDTVLPVQAALDWTGCPEVPDQVMELIKHLI